MSKGLIIAFVDKERRQLEAVRVLTQRWCWIATGTGPPIDIGVETDPPKKHKQSSIICATVNVMAQSADLRTILFHGLSDPTRQRIVEFLRTNSPARVTDVVAAIDISQPNASTHLACLWECGLAERERRGREVHYRLAESVEDLLGIADVLLDRAGDRIESCPNYGRGRRRQSA